MKSRLLKLRARMYNAMTISNFFRKQFVLTLITPDINTIIFASGKNDYSADGQGAYFNNNRGRVPGRGGRAPTRVLVNRASLDDDDAARNIIEHSTNDVTRRLVACVRYCHAD